MKKSILKDFAKVEGYVNSLQGEKMKTSAELIKQFKKETGDTRDIRTVNFWMMYSYWIEKRYNYATDRLKKVSIDLMKMQK